MNRLNLFFTNPPPEVPILQHQRIWLFTHHYYSDDFRFQVEYGVSNVMNQKRRDKWNLFVFPSGKSNQQNENQVIFKGFLFYLITCWDAVLVANSASGRG